MDWNHQAYGGDLREKIEMFIGYFVENEHG